MDIKADWPDKLFHLREWEDRFIVAYGGRGGAKSWGFAQCLIIKSLESQKRILCTREVQNTIKDSVLKLLSDTIIRMELSDFFKVTEKTIISRNGSDFLFKGLRHNIDEIKSTEGIDICWVEEAQRVSAKSWEILIPTVRKEKSQFYIGFNPDGEEDYVYKNFVINPRDGTRQININYWDNPFFPDVLRAEMEYDKRNDYDKYLHVWEGQTLQYSDAQVFKDKFRIEAFESPDEKDTVFRFGGDWGFSQDPLVLIRCFIKERTLFIDHEAYGVNIEIPEMPQAWSDVPLAPRYRIKTDPSRPELISYMRNNGYPEITKANAGKGSIIAGVKFLRSFEEIIIHERCKHTADEFKLYSYKKDRLTDEILPVIIDKHNHCIDSIRYAVEDIWDEPFKFERHDAKY